MSSHRLTRVNELIRRELGQAFYRLLGNEGIDLSSLTVTHVITSPNLRQARVLVSIRDHLDERDAMLATLRRHRADLQQELARHLVLKYTPRLSFVLDTSVERGDHVLHLLSEIEGKAPDANAASNRAGDADAPVETGETT